MLGCIALIPYICLTHGPDSFVCHWYLIVGISRGIQHIHIALCHLLTHISQKTCWYPPIHLQPYIPIQELVFSVPREQDDTECLASLPDVGYPPSMTSVFICWRRREQQNLLYEVVMQQTPAYNTTVYYVVCWATTGFLCLPTTAETKRVGMEGLPSWTHDHSTVRELEEPRNQVDNKDAHLWWGILSYIQYKQSCARAKGRGCATAWGSVHQPLSYLAAGTYKSPWCNTNSAMWALTVREMRTATWREGMMKDGGAWCSPSLG